MAQASWRAVKASGDGFEHYMYVQPGGGAADVFVANVYAGRREAAVEDVETCLRETLAALGDVETVELLQSSGSQKTVAARVRFASQAVADRLVGAEPPKLRLPAERVAKLAKTFATADEALEAHLAECESLEDHERKAEETLGLFEADRAAELARRAELRAGVPDDDGFVTVTYKRKAVGEAPRDSAKRSKKKPPAAPDFYRFQLREAKRAKLAQLRESVQADRNRAAKIQAAADQRKFKA